ncbi:hypothetical protein K439DRAFT_1621906 [Ramaria rubella]|nr:hypothetical protein K439DRAFT_1621906 [Ramaria rubella]
MDTAEQIAMTSGWMDDCLDNLPPAEECIPIDGMNKAPPEWQTILDNEKERCIDARLHHMGQVNSQQDPVANSNHADFVPDQVKILDASYFLKEFQAKQTIHQQQIDDTVNVYGLNTDQERAFRIVANHAVQHSGEQLKMYLGGMAGTGKSQVIKALAQFFEE